MITGELKNRIDRVWDAFWLDDLQTLAENRARVTRGPIENPTFLPGQEHLCWSRFKNDDPR